MKKGKYPTWGFITILFLIALVIILSFMVQQKPRDRGTSLSSSPQLYPYPPPGDSPLSSSPQPYPPPGDSPLGTPTLQPSPRITVVPGPPPGWPTDQPWPPENVTPTILTKNPPTPFPTPEFRPEPNGDRDDHLQRIIYPYYPQVDASPILQAVEIDQQIQRWQVLDPMIDLELLKPILGPDPGPILVDFHLSPNNRWLAADFAYVGSQLVDLSTGKIVNPFPEELTSNWGFLAWDTHGESIIASTVNGYQIVDLASLSKESFPVLNFAREKVNLKAIAISPDDGWIADAVVYPRTLGVRDIEVTEIGLRDDIRGEREVLVKNEGGIHVVDYSLQWSPKGNKLIWIVVIANNNGNLETQLWLYDFEIDRASIIDIVGKDTQYFHKAAWSFDGNLLAVIKESVDENNSIHADLLLIDLSKESQSTIAQSEGEIISHLQWSRDGQWIAFTIGKEDFGEIWVTNLNGSQQFPVAGPTLPRAPFIWLP